VLPGAPTCRRLAAQRFPARKPNLGWRLSFPNLRNGTYSAFSIIRVISYAAGYQCKGARKGRTGRRCRRCSGLCAGRENGREDPDDPGLLLLRSHYQQYDGAGTLIGAVR